MLWRLYGRTFAVALRAQSVSHQPLNRAAMSGRPIFKFLLKSLPRFSPLRKLRIDCKGDAIRHDLCPQIIRIKYVEAFSDDVAAVQIPCEACICACISGPIDSSAVTEAAFVFAEKHGQIVRERACTRE